MKILIIGGAGYVGSVLVKEFLKQRHEVIILDLLNRGSNGIKDVVDNKTCYLINADYMTGILPRTLKLYEPEVVIHLAAIVGDKACKENKELATKTNVEGVRYLVQEINKLEIPLFIASTCSVYGTNPNTCTEKSITFPISHYAKTKLEMEKLVQRESKYAIIFRFGTMYGWSPNMRFDLVVNRLVYDAVKLHKFKIFGGKQVRPFLHPKDLAYLLMCLFKKDLKKYNGQVFNLVSENLSMDELGELILYTLPYLPEDAMSKVPEKEVERSYCCRSNEAYKKLGFMPKIRVRNGIQEIEKQLIKTNMDVILKNGKSTD